MFDIILMQMLDEKNKVSKNPTAVATYTGTLKEASSIIDPVVTVQGDVSGAVKCNYLSIPKFGRFYFITNIRSLAENLFEISAHVDVLYSFKDDILKNSAIVRRQEHKWNLYLNDGAFRTYQNPEIATQVFPNSFVGESFVLAVAGNADNA